MTFPESRKRRSTTRIITEVLGVTTGETLKTQIMYKANLSFAQLSKNLGTGGALKTQIMYKANLSFAQLKEYLGYLIGSNLIIIKKRGSKDVYYTTPKGILCQFANELEMDLLITAGPQDPYLNKRTVEWYGAALTPLIVNIYKRKEKTVLATMKIS